MLKVNSKVKLHQCQIPVTVKSGQSGLFSNQSHQLMSQCLKSVKNSWNSLLREWTRTPVGHRVTEITWLQWFLKKVVQKNKLGKPNILTPLFNNNLKEMTNFYQLIFHNFSLFYSVLSVFFYYYFTNGDKVMCLCILQLVLGCSFNNRVPCVHYQGGGPFFTLQLTLVWHVKDGQNQYTYSS